MSVETWGMMPKNSEDPEKIEEAIDRLVEAHNDDPDSHLEEGQSLRSHRASDIIDHRAESVVEDKIRDLNVTNRKIDIIARTAQAIVKTGITEDEVLYPNAVGSETNIDYQWPAEDEHFDKVNDPGAGVDDSLVYNMSQAFQRDLYGIDSYASDDDIDGVVVTIRCNEGAFGTYATIGKPAIRIGGQVFEGEEKIFPSGWTNYSWGWPVNPATGNPWTEDDINNLEIGVSIKGADPDKNGSCSLVFATVIKRTEGGEGVFSSLERAIEYIKSTELGEGKILIMPGTYCPICKIDLASNIDIRGIDPLRTVLDFGGKGEKWVEMWGDSEHYATGTIAVTAEDATVTGSSTSWLANLEEGDWIKIDNSWFKIKTVDTDTSLELEAPYEGKSQSGLSYSAGAMAENIFVRGITVKGAGSPAGEHDKPGILFVYCLDSAIEDCYILESINAGIVFATSSRVRVKNDWFFGNGIWALNFNIVTNSIIEGCHSLGSRYDDFALSYCSGVIVCNNFSSGCGRNGFSISFSSDCLISGNVAKNAVGQGFKLWYDSSNISLIGNQAIGCSGDGIELDGHASYGWPSYCILNGNIIRDNGAYGVDVVNAGCIKNIILGNQIRGNTSGAINDQGTDTEAAHNIVS
jgi:hypothetical protein